MISTALQTVLYPLIWAMEITLDGLVFIFGSAGLSIIILAILVNIILLPLVNKARKIELEYISLQTEVNQLVAEKTANLKGEEKFRATEAIYEEKGYHPIKSLWTSLSFLVMLPVFIAAYLFFTNSEALNGVSFLIIESLGQEDRLLGPLNLLPLLMLGVSLLDAYLRFKNQKSELYKYLVLSIFIFVLVYSAPSALLIYWTTNTLIALVSFRFIQSIL